MQKTVVMIQLIMGKIKSKCKINLSRCRGWDQIDAPSVHASEICSPEWSLAAGAHMQDNSVEIQHTGVSERYLFVVVLQYYSSACTVQYMGSRRTAGRLQLNLATSKIS